MCLKCLSHFLDILKKCGMSSRRCEIDCNVCRPGVYSSKQPSNAEPTYQVSTGRKVQIEAWSNRKIHSLACVLLFNYLFQGLIRLLKGSGRSRGCSHGCSFALVFPEGWRCRKILVQGIFLPMSPSVFLVELMLREPWSFSPIFCLHIADFCMFQAPMLFETGLSRICVVLVPF